MLHPLIAAASLLPIKKPIRTLVYAYTYSAPAGHGQGTVTADVMGVTPDGGLIVRLSQIDGAKTDAASDPQECAVYGDTRVLCQKQNALSPFENELAHYLGRGFVSGDKMDANNHWRVASNNAAGSVTDDFTVTSNNGGILSINEVREVAVNSDTTMHHTATLTYDMNRTVPTHLSYKDSVGTGTAMAIGATYTLQSDSMAALPSPAKSPR